MCVYHRLPEGIPLSVYEVRKIDKLIVYDPAKLESTFKKMDRQYHTKRVVR